GNLRVVDRLVDPVGRSALADFELDVEQEHLPEPLLVRVDAVAPEHLQPVQLDDHPATARATARASTCSRTSCARRLAAPRSYAATAAPTDAAVEPVVASGSPTMRPSELLREKPTRIGRPSATSSGNRRTSSKLCATVFPKPMPGSRQIRSSRT